MKIPQNYSLAQFQNVCQQLNLSLLLVLKEDPPSNLLEEKKSDQLGLPQTLQQEFSLINVQIRNVNVEVGVQSLMHCLSCLRVAGGGTEDCVSFGFRPQKTCLVKKIQLITSEPSLTFMSIQQLPIRHSFQSQG